MALPVLDRSEGVYVLNYYAMLLSRERSENPRLNHQTAPVLVLIRQPNKK